MYLYISVLNVRVHPVISPNITSFQRYPIISLCPRLCDETTVPRPHSGVFYLHSIAYYNVRLILFIYLRNV